MFVAAGRHHGVRPCCRVLRVARCAVRSVMFRPVCARRVADDAIKPIVIGVFNANYQVYAQRKMRAVLRREHGINVDKDRVARLMRELGLRGFHMVQVDGHDPPGPDLAQGTGFGETTLARRPP